MKTLTSKLTLAAAAIVLALMFPCFSSSQAFGQEGEAQQRDAGTNDRAQERNDGDFISKLNLTPEQIRQIREIRQQIVEELRTNRQRMGQAQRALDEAIYADTVSEAEVEARASDLGKAQAAFTHTRAQMELRVRRVLTPEQLNLFRQMRQEAINRNRELRRERRDDPSAFQQRQRQNLQRNIKPNALPAQRSNNQRARRP